MKYMLLILLVIVVLVIVITIGICRYFSLRKLTTGVLTFVAAVVALIITAAIIAPRYNAMTIESTIRNKHPIFEYLAKNSPADFNAYITQIKADILSEVDVNKKVETDTSVFINNELKKYSQTASNQSIFDYTTAIYNLYKKQIEIDPVLVLSTEFPDKFSHQDISIKEDAEDREQLLAAKEEIIKSAIENPQPPLSDADKQQAKLIMQSILIDLANKYGKDKVLAIFQNPDNPTVDKKEAATVLLEFYNELLTKGVADTGLVIKYTLSGNS